MGRLDPQEYQRQYLDDVELRIRQLDTHWDRYRFDRPLLMEIARRDLADFRRSIFEYNRWWDNARQLKRAEAAFAKLEKRAKEQGPVRDALGPLKRSRTNSDRLATIS